MVEFDDLNEYFFNLLFFINTENLFSISNNVYHELSTEYKKTAD